MEAIAISEASIKFNKARLANKDKWLIVTFSDDIATLTFKSYGTWSQTIQYSKHGNIVWKDSGLHGLNVSSFKAEIDRIVSSVFRHTHLINFTYARVQ